MNPADTNQTDSNNTTPADSTILTPPPPAVTSVPPIIPSSTTPSAGDSTTIPTVGQTTSGNSSSNKKAIVATVVGLVVVLVGLGVGVLLSQQNQSPQTGATTPTNLSCSAINVYNQNWQNITTNLSSIEPGQTIRLVAQGSGDQANYSAAKFKINGVEQPETLLRRPEGGEFYFEYTVPESGVLSFSISAQVKGASNGLWY